MLAAKPFLAQLETARMAAKRTAIDQAVEELRGKARDLKHCHLFPAF
jgi:hypothetical protein